jgi:hypothetical protein
MKWVSTFPGVHHLKGGNPFWKIWIDERDTFTEVVRTKAGTFIAPRLLKTGTLEECKVIGEKWGKDTTG